MCFIVVCSLFNSMFLYVFGMFFCVYEEVLFWGRLKKERNRKMEGVVLEVGRKN